MLLGAHVKSAIPFAVIKTGDMPCCCILGANFLRINEFTIYFTHGILSSPVGEIVCSLNKQGSMTLFFSTIWQTALCCSLTETHNSSDVSEETEDVENTESNFSICWEKLINLQNADQNADHVLKKHFKKLPSKQREDSFLAQFKYHSRNLHVISELLVKDSSYKIVPVIPFLLLVEIVYKVHIQLVHTGKTKLIDVISKHFWHPTMDSVCEKFVVHAAIASYLRFLLRLSVLSLSKFRPTMLLT